MIIGIYKISNKVNGKVYIGQSWNIEKRFKEHRKRELNNHLKNAFNKYEIENFSFEIIMTFKNGPFTQKYLDKFEDYYIKFYDSMNSKKGYNKREGGSNGKMSKESKIKIGNASRGEKNANYGKKFSKETLFKMRIAKLGIKQSEELKIKRGIYKKGKDNPHYGIIRSDETKYKIKISRNKMAVVCIETKEKFDSVTEASKKYKIDKKSILNVCRNIINYNTAGGFHWMFLSDYDENKIYNFRKNKTNEIKVINIDTMEIFDSITKAAKKYNLSISNIHSCCNKKQKTAGGYQWMYYIEYLKLGLDKKSIIC